MSNNDLIISEIIGLANTEGEDSLSELQTLVSESNYLDFLNNVSEKEDINDVEMKLVLFTDNSSYKFGFSHHGKVTSFKNNRKITQEKSTIEILGHRKLSMWPGHENQKEYPVADDQGGSGNINLSWFANYNIVTNLSESLVYNIYEGSGQLLNKIDNIWFFDKPDNNDPAAPIEKRTYYRPFFVPSDDDSSIGSYHYQVALSSDNRTIPFTLANNGVYQSARTQFTHNSTNNICTSGRLISMPNDIALAAYQCIFENLQSLPLVPTYPTNPRAPVGGTNSGWILNDVDNPMTEFKFSVVVNPQDKNDAISSVNEAAVLAVFKSWGYSTFNCSITIDTSQDVARNTFLLQNNLSYRIYTFSKLNLADNF